MIQIQVNANLVHKAVNIAMKQIVVAASLDMYTLLLLLNAQKSVIVLITIIFLVNVLAPVLMEHLFFQI